MKNLTLKNFIWNIIGPTFNAFSSLIFLIIVTRLNGIDDAGVFTYCYATACLFYSIAVYIGRPYQVTDSSNLTDSDFIYNRLFTILVTLIIITGFGFIKQYDINKIVVLILLSIFRSIDALSESFYAIMQKNNHLYKVGFSYFIKSLIAYLTFFLVDYFTNNIILSIIVLILIYLVATYLYDYINIKKYGFKFKKYNSSNNRILLKNGFYVCLFSFVSLYILNSSRYAIDNIMTNTYQTIYGIIFMPAMVMSLLSQFIIHPFLLKIKESIALSKAKDLFKIVVKLIISFFLLGIIIVIICNYIGIPILELLYNIDLKIYHREFILIMISALFYGATIIISYVLVAMRKLKMQVLALISVAVLAIFTSNYFVNNYSLIGASFNTIITQSISFILLFLLFFIYTKRGDVN